METSSRRSLPKRLLLIGAGLFTFTLLFVIACRVAVQEMFRGLEQSRATGLSAVSWGVRSMWSGGGVAVDMAMARVEQISRNADLRALTSSFDQAVAQLNRVVSIHGGYLEDLRTESRSRRGRSLSAALALPSAEFDTTLSDLKNIGRIDSIYESGEDSAVKLASAARHFAAAQTNLARLKNLQQGRTGPLRDVVALEKEIAQANEAVAEAQRQHENLLSTIAQAHIRFTLLEEYKAPFEANLAGTSLQLRNSLVEGIGAIFSSLGIFVGVLFEYGLPLLFWIGLLFWPGRLVWRRFQAYRLATVRS
jgi:hypothetical protein